MNSYRVLAVVRLVVMLAAAVAAAVGHQVDIEILWRVAADVLALGAGVWAWWKNCPITPEAIDAQKYLERLRSGDEHGVSTAISADRIVTSTVTAKHLKTTSLETD